jgi:F-type H+-transporting ATPase subunit gamma
MEQIARLKARLASLGELRDLMRAIRALAAAHVQEAQAALPGIRRYVEVVEDAIAEGASLLPPGDTHVVRGRSRDGVLIVVGSEHGFVGAFDEQLLDRVAAVLSPGQIFGVIGRRGAALAAERGLDVAWSEPMATHVGGVLGVTRRVADRLANVSTASIVYGAYRRGGRYEVEVRRILPLDPKLLAGASANPALHQLGAEALLRECAGEYLFAEITRSVMESLASENGARLQVMEAADRNIADKLDTLTRRERAVRQDAITAELLDVITGAEAVMGEGDGI